MLTATSAALHDHAVALARVVVACQTRLGTLDHGSAITLGQAREIGAIAIPRLRDLGQRTAPRFGQKCVAGPDRMLSLNSRFLPEPCPGGRPARLERHSRSRAWRAAKLPGCTAWASRGRPTHLTAPPVIPEMILRWAKMKTTRSGRLDMTTYAKMRFQLFW